MSHDPDLSAGITCTDEDRSFWVLQDLCILKADGRRTGGAYALLEASVFPGTAGPPPHIHHNETESFYVLEGVFMVRCGDQTVTARAGSFVHVPRGMLHTFRNVGDSIGRVLILIVPAGLERFFERVVRPVIDRTAPPAVDPEVIEQIMTLAPQYHLEVPQPV
jgi:quercetin dioxygenase-like cupin family protein